MKNPYNNALEIPFALFLDDLVKKVTVIGIIGKTQGVSKAQTDRSGSRRTETEYPIERLLEERRGEQGETLFKVRWYGYTKADDTWEPAANIPPAFVARFRRKKRIQEKSRQKLRSQNKRKVGFSLVSTMTEA